MPTLSKRGSRRTTALIGNGTTKAKAVKSTKPPKVAKKPTFFASNYPGPNFPLPTEFVRLVERLQVKIRMPIWFLIQNPTSKELTKPFYSIDFQTFKGFQRHREEIPVKCALLVESPGGSAHATYQIARLFQR